jgi:hypothetical protein
MVRLVTDAALELHMKEPRSAPPRGRPFHPDLWNLWTTEARQLRHPRAGHRVRVELIGISSPLTLLPAESKRQNRFDEQDENVLF